MQKITKEEAEYIRKSNNHFCKDCCMYSRPDSCSLVIGIIFKFGSCKYWEPKRLLEPKRLPTKGYDNAA